MLIATSAVLLKTATASAAETILSAFSVTSRELACATTRLRAPTQERRPHTGAQLLRHLGRCLEWWRAGRFRLHPCGRRSLRCFVRGRACREPRKVLARQVFRLRPHHFGR